MYPSTLPDRQGVFSQSAEKRLLRNDGLAGLQRVVHQDRGDDQQIDLYSQGNTSLKLHLQRFFFQYLPGLIISYPAAGWRS